MKKKPSHTKQDPKIFCQRTGFRKRKHFYLRVFKIRLVINLTVGALIVHVFSLKLLFITYWKNLYHIYTYKHKLFLILLLKTSICNSN